MPNILINPSSGILEFNTGTAGSSSLASLSGAARLSFQNSGELNLTSYSTGTLDRFSIDGSQGRLFSVNDSLSGTIFSVNDIAGLPIIEVNSTTFDTVNIGSYGTNALYVSGSNVGVGTTSLPAKFNISESGLASTGSLAGSALNISQTWNTSGTPTAIKLNVTDTASNASSLLMDLQVSGSSRFSVDKTGRLVTTTAPSDTHILTCNFGNNRGLRLASINQGNIDFSFYGITIASTFGFNWGNTNSYSLRLLMDSANILAQQNGTNAQTFRLYNTFTDASNYERGFMRWSTNVLEIGAEAAGTGSNRNVTVNSPFNLNLNSNSNGKITLTSSGNTGILLQSTSSSTSIYTSDAATSSFTTILSLSRNAAGAFNFYTRAVSGTNYENKLASGGSYTKKFIIEAGSQAGGQDGCDVIIQSGPNSGSPTSRCGDLYLAPVNTAGSGRNGNLILLHDGTTLSNGNVGIGATSPTAKLDIDSNTIRLRTAKTPASATDTGNAGDICWDANYIYVCVATNTWKRSAISTWP